MGPPFKVSFERAAKQAIDIAIPGLVAQCVIHYTTAALSSYLKGKLCGSL